MERKSRPIVWNLSRVILINLLYQCICKPVLFKIGLWSATSLFMKGLVPSQLEQCRFAQYPLKVLRPRQRSRHFAVIFLKENCCILIRIVLLEWFPMVQWTFKHSFDTKISGSAKQFPTKHASATTTKLTLQTKRHLQQLTGVTKPNHGAHMENRHWHQTQ